jgi:hypothetical protein
MIDPVTAAIAATKSFAMIKAMVEGGKQVEDVFIQCGKWMGHVSDFTYSATKKEKPNLLKKLTHAKSVEQEALTIFAYKKKIQEQRKQVSQMIGMVYGKEGLIEYRTLCQQVVEQRKQEVYAHAEFQDTLAKIFVTIICVGLLGGFIWVLSQLVPA